MNQGLNKRSVYAFGMSGFGRQVFYIIQNTFLMYYFVSVAGLNATSVGIMMMLAKVWDAINDPIMGTVVENTRSRFGKVRPYLLFGSIPLGLFFAAMFAIPQSLSPAGKMAWATVTYIGVGMLFTLVEVPSQTLLVRITDNSSDRMRLSRSKEIIGTFGVILPPVLIPVLSTKMSNEWVAYAVCVGAFALLMSASYLLAFAGTRELPDRGQQQKINLFTGLKILFTNKYYVKYIMSYLLYGGVSALISGVIMFYVTAKFNQPTLTTLLSLIMMVSMFGAAVVAKPISDKLGKAKTSVLGLGAAVAGLVFRVVFGDASIIVLVIGLFVYCAGVSLYIACLWPMIGDAIDYSELRSGMRPESMAFASVTLISKIGEGISAAILGILLDVIGYSSSAAQQTEEAIVGLHHIGSTIPLALCVVILIILLTNDMDRRYSEYRAQLEEKRAGSTEL